MLNENRVDDGKVSSGEQWEDWCELTLWQEMEEERRGKYYVRNEYTMAG